MEQISEVVQVAINLWGDKHNEVSEYALVKAIVNDESEKCADWPVCSILMFPPSK